MYRLVSLLLVSTLSVSLSAQDTLSLSIEEAVALAVEQNYDIQVARGQYDIASRNNNPGDAGRYPTVDLNARQSNQYQYNQPSNPFALEGTNMSNNLNGSLDATWQVLGGGRVRFNIERLAQQQQLSAAALQVEVESQVLQVEQAYYQALLSQRRMEVFSNLIKLSRDRIEYNQAKAELGLGSSADVAQVASNYFNDSISQITQAIQFQQTLYNLKVLIGMDPAVPITLSTPLEHDPMLYATEEVVEQVLAENNQLSQARLNEEVALIDINLRQAAFRPNVSIQGGLTGNYTFFTADFPVRTTTFSTVDDYQLPPTITEDTNFDWGDFRDIQQAQIDLQNDQIINSANEITPTSRITQRGYNYGPYFNITFNLPLYDAGTRRRALANAKVTSEITQTRREQLERQVEANVRAALFQYNARVRNIDLAREAVDAANLLLSFVQSRYKAGVVNSFEFRQAQITYQNAAIAYNQSIFSAIEAHLIIERLTGQLVADL